MPATPLRILVILPMYGGSLPIGRYCAAALRALGHTVRLFEAPMLYPAFTGLKGLGLTPAQTIPLENAFSRWCLRLSGPMSSRWSLTLCWRWPRLP